MKPRRTEHIPPDGADETAPPDGADAAATPAEEERQLAEEIRRAAEELREQADQMRRIGERMRLDAEGIRQAHEEMRKSAEEARLARETLREASEHARIVAEDLRQEHEALRQAAAEQREVLAETRKAASEIDCLVRDRAESDPSTEWVARVSRAIIRAGDAVRVAMTHREAAGPRITARAHGPAREDPERVPPGGQAPAPKPGLDTTADPPIPERSEPATSPRPPLKPRVLN